MRRTYFRLQYPSLDVGRQTEPFRFVPFSVYFTGRSRHGGGVRTIPSRCRASMKRWSHGSKIGVVPYRFSRTAQERSVFFTVPFPVPCSTARRSARQGQERHGCRHEGRFRRTLTCTFRTGLGGIVSVARTNPKAKIPWKFWSGRGRRPNGSRDCLTSKLSGETDLEDFRRLQNPMRVRTDAPGPRTAPLRERYPSPFRTACFTPQTEAHRATTALRVRTTTQRLQRRRVRRERHHRRSAAGLHRSA